MKALRTHFVALMFVAASLSVVLILWDRLPDPMPTHWNYAGEIDGHLAKPWGPLLLPLSNALVITLLICLPTISPRMRRFERPYRVIVDALAGFMLLLTVVVCLVSIGWNVGGLSLVYGGAGVLFVILGNFMGKLTPNRFAGIRTPWTMSNDEVWFRTHRLGGKLFVAAGLFTIVGALAGHGVGALLSSALAASIVSIVYSYVIYQRLA
jgi:uncharacterized membrane protein